MAGQEIKPETPATLVSSLFIYYHTTTIMYTPIGKQKFKSYIWQYLVQFSSNKLKY